jgi:S1-C subfamily serine protease
MRFLCVAREREDRGVNPGDLPGHCINTKGSKTMLPLNRFLHFVSGAIVAIITASSLFSASGDNVVQPAADKVPPEAVSAVGISDAADTQKNPVEESVVKIFAQIRRPELSKPWTKQAPREVSGSGVVIEGKRILTNAHVVQYASQVQVQASQAGDKMSATVEVIAPGIDLAVLKLEDETFFNTHPPLARAASLPQIKDSVLVYGFPTGGTSLSITKGIVSRIEFTSYSFPVSGLRVQIDAAINPGNSGGPALVGDKVIGLAFSHLSNAQNIGYIIPSEEIDLFLKDVSDGRYDGKPALFGEFQTLENSALRDFLKLDKVTSGIVINEPFSDDASYPLKRWDVISKIGDAKIDDQGMIKISDGLRVRFAYRVQKIAKNGNLPLSIIRGSKEMTVEVPVSPNNPRLIAPLRGEYPPYFICGPIAFSIATEDLMSAFTSSTSGAVINAALSQSASPLINRRGDKPAFGDEQLVIVPAPFFPHKLTKGYSSHILAVVESINGTRIKNLLHLVQLLRDSQNEFIVIDFAGRGRETLVFPRAELIAATEEILSDNGVRALGSPEVMAVWSLGKTATQPIVGSAAKPDAKSDVKPTAKPVKK